MRIGCRRETIVDIMIMGWRRGVDAGIMPRWSKRGVHRSWVRSPVTWWGDIFKMDVMQSYRQRARDEGNALELYLASRGDGGCPQQEESNNAHAKDAMPL